MLLENWFVNNCHFRAHGTDFYPLFLPIPKKKTIWQERICFISFSKLKKKVGKKKDSSEDTLSKPHRPIDLKLCQVLN